jgi:hypothetical protein
MSELPTFEPWGAQLLPMEEVESLLTAMVRIKDEVADMSRLHDQSLAERHQIEADRYREVRRMIKLTDRVWLLTEPPDHPEFVQGSVYLVVIRSGKLIVKHKLIAA